eukprot:4347836-Prymnesium_polylepis.1
MAVLFPNSGDGPLRFLERRRSKWGGVDFSVFRLTDGDDHRTLVLAERVHVIKIKLKINYDRPLFTPSLD